MKLLFAKENFPLTVVVSLVIWAYIAFFSVVLS
jgi:hypothetical protein